MATVTGLTASRMLEIEAQTVVGGEIGPTGHLILTKHNGEQIDAGVFPDATTANKGVIEIATQAETEALTDNSRALTPSNIASTINAIKGRLTTLETPPSTTISVITGMTETSAASLYPVGLSLFSVSGTAWTVGTGSVVTSKSSNDRVVQYFYLSSGGTTDIQAWVRSSHSSVGGGGWTQWRQLDMTVTLNSASFTQTTPVGSYPQGWSRLYYTAVTSSTWDFSGLPGEVRTYKEGDYAKQVYTTHSSGSGGAPSEWFRTANASSGWTNWRKIVVQGPNLPIAMASGRESVTPVANVLTTKVVNFPAGRFGTTPNVTLTPDTTVPGSQVQEWSVSGISATSFTIYVLRTNNTNTLFQWIATEFA